MENEKEKIGSVGSKMSNLRRVRKRQKSKGQVIIYYQYLPETPFTVNSTILLLKN